MLYSGVHLDLSLTKWNKCTFFIFKN